MKNPATNTVWSIVLLALVAVSMIAAGLKLISRSEDIYKQSYDLTKNVLTANCGKTTSVQPSYGAVKDGYNQALSFFMLAAGCIILMPILPRLQNFSIGTGGITGSLQALQQNVSNMVQQKNQLQSQLAGGGGAKTSGVSLESTPRLQKDNLVSGKDRRMLATLKNADVGDAGPYEVEITVESTNESKPLTGVVNFHLEPSFAYPNPIIAVHNGEAILKLKKIQGPFTITAKMDEGETTLVLKVDKTNSAA